MNAEQLEQARRELATVEEQLRQLELPVDFEQLCRDGVLEKVVRGRRVGTTFTVLDITRLPEHAALRLKITRITRTTTKEGESPRSVTKCTAKLLGEATLKKKLLHTKKLLEGIIDIQERFVKAAPSRKQL